jgi:hypothetical protein
MAIGLELPFSRQSLRHTYDVMSRVCHGCRSDLHLLTYLLPTWSCFENLVSFVVLFATVRPVQEAGPQVSGHWAGHGKKKIYNIVGTNN